MSTVKRYLADGSTRQVMDEATLYRTKTSSVFRASRVEHDAESNRFYVDFTPLHDQTKQPEHQVCLVNTFDSYYQAVRAEVKWLVANYVLATE